MRVKTSYFVISIIIFLVAIGYVFLRFGANELEAPTLDYLDQVQIEQSPSRNNGDVSSSPDSTPPTHCLKIKTQSPIYIKEGLSVAEISQRADSLGYVIESQLNMVEEIRLLSEWAEGDTKNILETNGFFDARNGSYTLYTQNEMVYKLYAPSIVLKKEYSDNSYLRLEIEGNVNSTIVEVSITGTCVEYNVYRPRLEEWFIELGLDVEILDRVPIEYDGLSNNGTMELQ